MERRITVKGTGSVSLKPDRIVLTMDLEAKRLEYDKTMALAAESLEALQAAVVSAGFAREDLKTASFNISTFYESYQDEQQNYQNRFAGYVCSQGLKLEFDFDRIILGKVLNAVGGAGVTPNLNIEFTVKDRAAVDRQLLASAADNAKSKAQVLAAASGVALGELLSIDYDWADVRLYSATRYAVEEKAMALRSDLAPQIEPENITATDNATFVWALR